MSNDSASQIHCPNCGEAVDVNDVLYHQLEAELETRFREQLNEERHKLKQSEESLKSRARELETERESLESRVAEQVKAGVNASRERLKQELELENKERYELMERELAEKSGKVKELNRAMAEIERLKRANEEERSRLEAESQRRITTAVDQEREKIQKAEQERASLQLGEREKVIEQLKQQLQEAQRKAEQGSTQLQGEVQELAIEEWLSNQFPFDRIEEIKKGAQGADCIQYVSDGAAECGAIYYESKRTKSFSPAWIEKFKSDIREKGADVGILVTQAMPADMERLGQREGIWVCNFDEFKGLAIVIRDSLLRLSQAMRSQENRGDKMNLLYDFLTGNEFRLQIEAIVEGFTQLQTDLESEKRAMQGIWKKREKQIQKVLLNTNNMYSSVKGIAGNAVGSVALLELDPGLDSEADQENI